VDNEVSVDELLAACDADALEGLDARSLAALGRRVLALWSKLDAARLRLIAAVDRTGAYRVDGARDVAAWVADAAGDRRGTAQRDVELASTVAVMPAVADGLAEGRLSKAKAVELARAARATPDEQARLVAAAARLSAEQVGRHVDRWQIEHDGGAPDVAESVAFHPLPGGCRVEARLDTEGAEWVQVAVDAAAERLGLRDVPWEQRRANGLVGVCRYFLEHADVPETRVGRPTVVVTIDVEALAAEVGGSARLDSGAYVSGDVARRMACDAGTVRLITGPRSMPLDVGRRSRVPSPALSRAVVHRDRHCRYEGCTAPPWACEVHHLEFWARDHGRTDVQRLALVCWHHHSLAHRQSRTHDLVDRGDGRLTLRRRRREEPGAA
jgi:Domain of unknown function (DUF222)